MSTRYLKYVIFTGLFLVPFVPFLVSSSFFFPFITTKVFAWRIIVEIIFVAWLSLALVDTEYRPRKSVILYSVLGFLIAIGLADLFGVAPLKSFWSNFERMEGFISLLHLGMFFVVISSFFREIDWKRWWNTSLVASFIMVLYCVLQIIGLKTINQGGVRVDGTFGNAIYLAVYMLFHIFIAMLSMWREWQNTLLRWVYGLLIFLQIFILYYTATRGAILGLIGGLFVVAILNINNRESVPARKMSITLLISLIILIGVFFSIKNTEFVSKSPVLSRFSSLTTEELKNQGRYFVWPMAIEGWKENPILGWGQENFSYVFQKYYTPDMVHLEPWFDRAHNIFLDWLVVGGLIGLLAYLSLYIVLLYLIWWRNIVFSYTEKSIITGLIAAYFFHNFFVFDHLISYILFFSLLAYVHYLSSDSFSWQRSMTLTRVRNIVLPAFTILLVFSLYFVNIKPIITNINIIEALKIIQESGDIKIVIESLKKAYNTASLGKTEVVEQLASNSVAVLTSDISMEEKNTFFAFARDAVINQEKDKNIERDARYQLMAGSFLATTSILDEALVHLGKARELMPGKQQIYFEIGSAYINKKEPLIALETFKEAYELLPTYSEAKLIYLAGAIYANDKVVENEMISQLSEKELVFDDRIINAYYTNGRVNMVMKLLEDRIRLDPVNADTYRDFLKEFAN